MPLYVDEETGKSVTTHSMIKTGRHCMRQTMYKYVDRLKPRRLGKPLRRGSWMHTLLEFYHSGQDWRAEHQRLSANFSELFDEEKEHYGDLPVECLDLMESYIWHYKNDPWIVHEVEFIVEAEFPDGGIYRGKVDALIENEFGLWLVDHKTHKRFPDFSYRILDAQSALYLWAAQQSGLPVNGFIWNYVKTAAPSKPAMIKDGSRLSKVLGDTDYRTYVTELRRLKAEYGFVITREHLNYAEMLKKRRYAHGEPQTSPFFHRHLLEKDEAMLKRVVAEAFRTAQRLNEYDFEDRDSVERTVNAYSCARFCDMVNICTIELMGGNTRNLIKQNFRVGDPQSYYYDRNEDHGKEEN